VTIIDFYLGELLKENLEATPLLVNMAADAIIIYDEDGLLKSFIEKTRRLIEKAKLKRYRTIDGKYGWMRDDSKPLTPVEV
jgi:hypothetical protein